MPEETAEINLKELPSGIGGKGVGVRRITLGFCFLLLKPCSNI